MKSHPRFLVGYGNPADSKTKRVFENTFVAFYQNPNSVSFFTFFWS